MKKTGELGGAFIAASAESYKGKLRDLLAWYRRQMTELEIEVHLNDEVKDVSTFCGCPSLLPPVQRRAFCVVFTVTKR